MARRPRWCRSGTLTRPVPKRNRLAGASKRTRLLVRVVDVIKVGGLTTARDQPDGVTFDELYRREIRALVALAYGVFGSLAGRAGAAGSPGPGRGALLRRRPVGGRDRRDPQMRRGHREGAPSQGPTVPRPGARARRGSL